MAEILGVSSHTVSKWETYSSIPSFKVIYNFARYFNFTIDYVLGLSYDRTASNYKEYDKNLLIKRLKALRLNSSLTQRALSEKLGVTDGAIAGYEQGTINPSLDILYKYCKFFKISFHQLMYH